MPDRIWKLVDNEYSGIVEVYEKLYHPYCKGIIHKFIDGTCVWHLKDNLRGKLDSGVRKSFSRAKAQVEKHYRKK